MLSKLLIVNYFKVLEEKDLKCAVNHNSQWLH